MRLIYDISDNDSDVNTEYNKGLSASKSHIIHGRNYYVPAVSKGRQQTQKVKEPKTLITVDDSDTNENLANDEFATQQVGGETRNHTTPTSASGSDQIGQKDFPQQVTLGTNEKTNTPSTLDNSSNKLAEETLKSTFDIQQLEEISSENIYSLGESHCSDYDNSYYSDYSNWSESKNHTYTNNQKISGESFRNSQLWKCVNLDRDQLNKESVLSVNSDLLRNFVCLPSPPHTRVLKPHVNLPYLDTDKVIFLRDLENGPKFELVEYAGPIEYIPDHMKSRLALTCE